VSHKPQTVVTRRVRQVQREPIWALSTLTAAFGAAHGVGPVSYPSLAGSSRDWLLRPHPNDRSEERSALGVATLHYSHARKLQARTGHACRPSERAWPGGADRGAGCLSSWIMELPPSQKILLTWKGCNCDPLQGSHLVACAPGAATDSNGPAQHYFLLYSGQWSDSKRTVVVGVCRAGVANTWIRCSLRCFGLDQVFSIQVWVPSMESPRDRWKLRPTWSLTRISCSGQFQR